MTGAAELRRIVSVLNNTREDFNDKFATEELVALVRWCASSPYDVTPDQLPAVCIKEALRGAKPSPRTLAALSARLGE